MKGPRKLDELRQIVLILELVSVHKCIVYVSNCGFRRDDMSHRPP